MQFPTLISICLSAQLLYCTALECPPWIGAPPQSLELDSRRQRGFRMSLLCGSITNRTLPTPSCLFQVFPIAELSQPTRHKKLVPFFPSVVSLLCIGALSIPLICLPGNPTHRLCNRRMVPLVLPICNDVIPAQENTPPLPDSPR